MGDELTTFRPEERGNVRRRLMPREATHSDVSHQVVGQIHEGSHNGANLFEATG